MEISKIKKLVLDRSVPVTNNPDILKWLVDCQLSSYKSGRKNLSKNLINELTDLFGDPNRSIRLEFMTKVWVLQYGDLVFNVFSAKTKGTSIEICGYDYEEVRIGIKSVEIIRFLEDLHSLIN